MRTFFTALFVSISVFGAALYFSRHTDNSVDRQTFYKAHNFLNRRIDTVIYKIDTVSVNVQQMREQLNRLEQQFSSMQGDLDSLKKGQILIYGAVRDLEQPQQASSSFKLRLEQLYDYLFQN